MEHLKMFTARRLLDLITTSIQGKRSKIIQTALQGIILSVKDPPVSTSLLSHFFSFSTPSNTLGALI